MLCRYFQATGTKGADRCSAETPQIESSHRGSGLSLGDRSLDEKLTSEDPEHLGIKVFRHPALRIGAEQTGQGPSTPSVSDNLNPCGSVDYDKPSRLSVNAQSPQALGPADAVEFRSRAAGEIIEKGVKGFGRTVLFGIRHHHGGARG
jgi:hypothetical protein